MERVRTLSGLTAGLGSIRVRANYDGGNIVGNYAESNDYHAEFE